MQAFSSCSEQGLLLIVVHGLPIAVASLVAEHRALGPQTSVVVAHRLSSCGRRAYLLHSMWNLPGPRIQPVSSALAGRCATREALKMPSLMMNVLLILGVTDKMAAGGPGSA